jgi:hypothetical protein
MLETAVGAPTPSCNPEKQVKKISFRSGLLATTTICGAALSTLAGGALVATVATMLPATAQAQDFTSGAVGISVDDSSGAPVAGAIVTLVSQAQGITKTLTTSASGNATATGLAPGEYNVTVSKDGYDLYESTATVIVSQEVTYTYALNTTGAAQTVVVKGKRVRQDFNRTTSGLSVDLTTLVAQQPIGRSIQAVTMLAPTVVNSTAFGQPSIGGGSAAENAYYVNGLNVTNPDTYVGGAEIPFDFYKTVDVQTSGSPAEFGRATGGVVNSTTKSGTNQFMFAIHGNFAPDSLRSDPFVPDHRTNPITGADLSVTASPAIFRTNDSSSLSIESGGALIKDKLFLYGLVQLQDTKSQFSSWSSGYLERDENTSPFYGLKADWYITPGQHLELTYLDTTAETKQTRYSYTCANIQLSPAKVCDDRGSDAEIDYSKPYGATTTTGGPSWVLKYTGNVTDWFTVSAAYGESKYKNDFISDNPDDYYSASYNAGYFVRTSENQIYSAGTSVDDWTRKFLRADADLRFEAMGKHHVRFGFEQEDLSMDKTLKLPGAQPIRYLMLPDYSYGYILYENLGGHVSSKNTAYYIQDSWDVTSTLNLQLGLRNDDFKNNNLSGQEFLSLTGNLAPRVGLSWKPSEDSKWRFTAYYGQTFIPPAMNLGFRGKDFYFAEYFYMPEGGYVLDPVTGLPTDMGTPFEGLASCPTYPAGAPGNVGTGGIDACAVFGNGTQEPATKKAAEGLEATRSSEFTLGSTYRLNDMWTLGLTYVNRTLDRVSEDTDFAPQINAYCESKGYTTCNFTNEYHVWNVGDSVTINTFETLPGGETQLTLTNLGFPKPKRDYYGLTFDFKRAFDGKWGLQGSYTYSRSTGNYEGTVLSTGNGGGQTDAGSTLLYDYVHLADNSGGVMANNRDHEFKVWGSYALTEDLLIGANVSVISPYYFSCLSRYPGGSSDPAYGYGKNFHYCLDTSKALNSTGATPYYAFTDSPQGKGGKSDWTKTIDVSLRYTLPASMPYGGKLVLRADIFNLFNDKEVVAQTNASDGSFSSSQSASRCNGKAATCSSANPLYGVPTVYNTPRYMRVGFDMTF